MAIKQLENGKFRCQIDRKGIPRVRKTFDNRHSAELFEREYLHAHHAKSKQNSDSRTLIELIELWYRYHGVNLADGKRRKNVLESLAAGLGNPIASNLTAEKFLDYRFNKTSIKSKPPLSSKTFNNHHGYLNALYRKLRKLKIIDYDSPIAEIDFIKIQERQLSYLSMHQIELIMDALKTCRNNYVWYIAQICIRTGARWGEAETLTKKQLHNGRITFEFTKSKKIRTVPLDTEFYRDLIYFCRYKNPDDRIFKNSMMTFRRVVARTGVNMPKGQSTHILRHSFASYFVMNGGNILTLQKILGHADIKMTMRYAHLAPDHLQDAVNLNPLSSIRCDD